MASFHSFLVLPRSSPVRSKLKLGPNLCYTSSHRCTPVQLGHNCPIRSREKVTLGFSHGPMPAQLTGFTGSHRSIHSCCASCFRHIEYSIDRIDFINTM